MKVLAQYSIPFRDLDNSDHEYNFIVSDIFFKCFENSEILGSDIEVKLILSKNSSSINLSISLCGKVKIKCDRCLEEYFEKIDFTDNINVEFGDETNFDTNEDYVILDRNANEINISQFIFEFAHFALPLVHYHPNDKNGNSGCNPKMIEALKKYSNPKRIKKADSRWEKLQEIKNKM